MSDFFLACLFGSGFLFGEVAGSAPRTVRGKEGRGFGELSAYSMCFLGGFLSFFRCCRMASVYVAVMYSMLFSVVLS